MLHQFRQDLDNFVQVPKSRILSFLVIQNSLIFSNSELSRSNLNTFPHQEEGKFNKLHWSAPRALEGWTTIDCLWLIVII